MKRILLTAVLVSVSFSSFANDSLLEEFKGETSENIHKEFFTGKGFAEIKSSEQAMLRFNDEKESITFVLKENKVIDAYKVKK